MTVGDRNKGYMSVSYVTALLSRLKKGRGDWENLEGNSDLSELLSLPQNSTLRRNIQELITSWRITVINQENLTEDDQEVIMNLSQAYLEWREATLQEGQKDERR
ncbi:MAG: hypothetical protein V7K50_08400 [Nostoc sp.]|uniref:hypothetical protein n=1 Tax=Nostoc sp. TaxID=1180 RepID=UPI002FFA7836